MWGASIHVAACRLCLCQKATVNADTCSTTKRNQHTWQDGNTHLEGNIIILVNRSASLQHIFWRPVFVLLVRQRCLPCGHRKGEKKKEKKKERRTTVNLRDVSEEDARGVCEISVPVSASLQPSLCSHYCVWPQNDHRALPEENHTLISLCQKTEATITTWKTISGGVYTDQSRKRRWQTGGNICLILQSGAVHPGVGRWLTECARTPAAPTTLYFLMSETSGSSFRLTLSPNSRWRLTHPPQVVLHHWERVRAAPQTRRREAELWPISLNTLHV